MTQNKNVDGSRSRQRGIAPLPSVWGTGTFTLSANGGLTANRKALIYDPDSGGYLHNAASIGTYLYSISLYAKRLDLSRLFGTLVALLVTVRNHFSLNWVSL